MYLKSLEIVKIGVERFAATELKLIEYTFTRNWDNFSSSTVLEELFSEKASSENQDTRFWKTLHLSHLHFKNNCTYRGWMKIYFSWLEMKAFDTRRKVTIFTMILTTVYKLWARNIRPEILIMKTFLNHNLE